MVTKKKIETSPIYLDNMSVVILIKYASYLKIKNGLFNRYNLFL